MRITLPAHGLFRHRLPGRRQPGRWGFHENDGMGLYYFARYYSPTFQRFISEDSARIDGGANSYAYAAEQPVDALGAPGNPDFFGGSGGTGESCLICEVALDWHPALKGIEVPHLAGPWAHAYWYTQIGSSTGTDSGEATLHGAQGPLGFLNHYPDFSDDLDDVNRRVARAQTGTGWCPLAFSVRSAGTQWPNYRFDYRFFPGPNSNTVAAFIDFHSGAFWGPPEGTGYNFVGWFYDPGL